MLGELRSMAYLLHGKWVMVSISATLCSRHGWFRRLPQHMIIRPQDVICLYRQVRSIIASVLHWIPVNLITKISSPFVLHALLWISLLLIVTHYLKHEKELLFSCHGFLLCISYTVIGTISDKGEIRKESISFCTGHLSSSSVYLSSSFLRS